MTTQNRMNPENPDEGHIVQAFVAGLGQAAPHAGTFDVNADVIDFGMHPGQSDGVFTLAAAQLQHDGMVVMEKLGPLAFQRKSLRHDALVGVFKEVVEGLVLRKFLQFVFLAHGSVI